jgi:hypothetical protein
MVTTQSWNLIYFKEFCPLKWSTAFPDIWDVIVFEQHTFRGFKSGGPIVFHECPNRTICSKFSAEHSEMLPYALEDQGRLRPVRWICLRTGELFSRLEQVGAAVKELTALKPHHCSARKAWSAAQFSGEFPQPPTDLTDGFPSSTALSNPSLIFIFDLQRNSHPGGYYDRWAEWELISETKILHSRLKCAFLCRFWSSSSLF